MTAARSGYSMKMAMALKSRLTTASVAAVYSVITRSAQPGRKAASGQGASRARKRRRAIGTSGQWLRMPCRKRDRTMRDRPNEEVAATRTSGRPHM